MVATGVTGGARTAGTDDVDQSDECKSSADGREELHVERLRDEAGEKKSKNWDYGV